MLTSPVAMVQKVDHSKAERGDIGLGLKSRAQHGLEVGMLKWGDYFIVVKYSNELVIEAVPEHNDNKITNNKLLALKTFQSIQPNFVFTKQVTTFLYISCTFGEVLEILLASHQNVR